jgi:hypothetical protein
MLLVLLSCVLAVGSVAPQAKAVGVRYSDGVVSYTRLQQGGGFWKPSVPTVAGARTERDGLRLYALEVTHQIEGTAIFVKVSLRYGGASGTLVPAARRQLRDGEEYLVEELRAFGVEPVTLFLADMPAAGHFRKPVVETTSADLDAAVDIAPGDVPHFQVSLTNTSARPLLAFYVQMSQGDQPPATRRPRNLDGAPLAQPGETYVLDVRAPIRARPDGLPQWAIPDQIMISQLRWGGGPPAVSAQARAAIHAPASRLGRTYESLEHVLPPPVRRFTVAPFENPHAEVLQARWTVDYGGIDVTFLASPSSTSILVTEVTVTDLKWLKVLGVDIARSRFEIEKRLGAPLTFDSRTMRYEDEEGSDIGPSTMTLHFDGDRLVRASWAFPWD